MVERKTARKGQFDSEDGPRGAGEQNACRQLQAGHAHWQVVVDQVQHSVDQVWHWHQHQSRNDQDESWCLGPAQPDRKATEDGTDQNYG
jgi:hypothetical protein